MSKNFRILPYLLLLTVGIVIFLSPTPVSSERILVLTFIASKSHKITYMKLVEELASRGHNITVVSSQKPLRDVQNIKEIFTYDFDAVMAGKLNMMKMKEENRNLNPFEIVPQQVEICEKIYQMPEIQAVMEEDFDLIFMQSYNDCAYGVVWKIQQRTGAPLVIFVQISAPSSVSSKVGSYLPPSFVTNPFLSYSDEMTFYQRFVNFGFNMLFDAVLSWYIEPKMTDVYRRMLNDPNIPTASEFTANASLILSNGHFTVSKPKPYLPDVVDVGGIHSTPAKPLPKDLEEFVTKNGKDGFIYFSLGSIVKGEMMSEERRKLFLNVFSKLKQQVVWKWETETMPDLPKNVKLSKWLPQQDLLGHPNIKMFITHCGGGGTEEAIYHGVPLIGMPFFGDQTLNSQIAKNLGFLVEVDWNEITEEMLTDAINEILSNSKYTDNAKQLSKVFKDRPMSALETGVYWVEYVMRHKGAPQLRSAARKLNYFQYQSWDVIGAYLAIIGTILYIIKLLICLVCRVCCCRKSNAAKTVASKKKVQ